MWLWGSGKEEEEHQTRNLPLLLSSLLHVTFEGLFDGTLDFGDMPSSNCRFWYSASVCSWFYKVVVMYVHVYVDMA